MDKRKSKVRKSKYKPRYTDYHPERKEPEGLLKEPTEGTGKTKTHEAAGSTGKKVIRPSTETVGKRTAHGSMKSAGETKEHISAGNTGKSKSHTAVENGRKGTQASVGSAGKKTAHANKGNAGQTGKTAARTVTGTTGHTTAVSPLKVYAPSSPHKNTRRNVPKKNPVFSRSFFSLLVELVLIFVLLVGANREALLENTQEVLPDSILETMGDLIATEESAEPEEEAEESKEIAFEPHSVESTVPSNLISYTEVQVDGTTLSDVSEYTSSSEISFLVGEDYTDMEGVITFRGNNFRDSPSYGYAEMENFSLNAAWSYGTGSLTSQGEYWSGSGWTGQPLITRWSREAKANMNMYDWAKEDDDLVEVIYACMDGYVYFLDLYTGQATRDALYLGYTFKGAGALDPRGYPILYVGAGYNSDEGTARVFVVNLLDCSVMYTFGNADEFSLRGTLSFFDSSPLVDAETDTLIYPGENGILYLIRLNTQYDETAGTLSISPGSTVKWHYYGTRSSTSSYWIGMEDSAAVYKGYLFVADNGGNLMCLDLNTLQLVWVQDTLDDSNSTPVLSIEEDHLYLYVSTSFRLGWRSYDQATIPVWKIDAETGEIVWQKDYQCYSDDGVSGGVQSTIACGKEGLSEYIYVTVSKTSSNATGVLACLNKNTGEVVWEHSTGYAWSSPVCVYNSDGTGKVLYCDCNGNMYLLDGITGEVHSTISLSDGVIEASPAVYNNYAIVGTRDCAIWGIELQ
ncbi:MAG: PQQ-binding-like beta-propeller repeat protein [Clostridiales bacterium]|nr:PQQ-binding-like beta-propeller repeat protein [Clostridiales bacterium]